MLEKLTHLEERFRELGSLLSDPEIIADRVKYQKLAKERSQIEPLAKKYQRYEKVIRQMDEAQEFYTLEKDIEFKTLAKLELDKLSKEKETLERELRILLVPPDPNDEKNTIMEIRAGTGGNEAALFAGGLFRMYSKYAQRKGWKINILSAHPGEVGGFKEIIFSAEGEKVYSGLKYESGTHRVQRVPVTEAGGRIHTSAATVAVLPEAEPIDIQIKPEDLHIDTYRASGAGGQHVNVTDSAVRITHLPTKIVASCQDERSQHKNKAKALKILYARLFDHFTQEQIRERAQERKIQIGTGDRSERIRTYNFPQGRVTDHRINLTLHKLDTILEGEIEELIQKLQSEDQIKKLEKTVTTEDTP
ncbi:peptide chain release factor 1 [bacterium]|nr:peptide chain release factor 1 [bacterium]